MKAAETLVSELYRIFHKSRSYVISFFHSSISFVSNSCYQLYSYCFI